MTVSEPERIPYFEPTFGSAEEEAVLEVLRSGWVSTGPRCEALEAEFAQRLGRTHAVSLSSCTAGLHLALRGLGLGPGDEVVVPSLTFVATASAVLMTGATPVFADIESLDRWTLCPRDVAAVLTERTRAVIAMHYGGFGADMDALGELARREGLALVEDACHAPLATLGERMLGTFGAVACYSFYSNKHVSCGEGGMLVADDEELAEKVRRLRSHGMTRTAHQRQGGTLLYDVPSFGYNYRMDDLRAAIALVQLGRLEEDLRHRETLVRRYRDRLAGVRGVVIPFSDYVGRSAHHVFGILVPPGADRDHVRSELSKRGVDTSVHYPPAHLFSCFRSVHRALPRTEEVGSRAISLPLFSGMSERQVDLVCERLRATLSEAP